MKIVLIGFWRSGVPFTAFLADETEVESFVAQYKPTECTQLDPEAYSIIRRARDWQRQNGREHIVHHERSSIL